MSQDETTPTPEETSTPEEAPIPLDYDDLAPLSLADEEDASGPISGRSSTRIQAFGAHSDTLGQQKHQYKRTPILTGTGAVRCRLFHSKITVAALDHMTDSINEWLDSDEIEVKYVAQVIGTMEGKKPEPNVIVTVWY
jgi:hypothetical protein